MRLKTPYQCPASGSQARRLRGTGLGRECSKHRRSRACSAPAIASGPAGKLWTTRATRNLIATLERLRVDRQLEEAVGDVRDLH
jgi:hypothetical protein